MTFLNPDHMRLIKREDSHVPPTMAPETPPKPQQNLVERKHSGLSNEVEYYPRMA